MSLNWIQKIDKFSSCTDSVFIIISIEWDLVSKKQLSLCSRAGLVVLAVSPTEGLSTSIFSRLLEIRKKSNQKKFNSKMYSARWQFNVAMRKSTQTLFALKFYAALALAIHSSNIKNSNNFEIFKNMSNSARSKLSLVSFTQSFSYSTHKSVKAIFQSVWSVWPKKEVS